jgi:hypothetical protein
VLGDIIVELEDGFDDLDVHGDLGGVRG